MKLIGVTGSGSTVVQTPVIIYEEAESLAREEQIVLVSDTRRELNYLAVLRNVKRYEPFLTSYRRTSYVDNPDLVDSGTLPYTTAHARLIGVIEGKMLNEVTLPPNPGSKVYVVESPRDLELELGKGLIIGSHKYSGIEIPLDPSAIFYHVAVIGATGTGKSRLTKALIDSILDRTSYSLIVFDHSGVDYTMYYPDHVVSASKIILDAATISDLILDKTGLDVRTYEPYVTLTTLLYMYTNIKGEVMTTGGLSRQQLLKLLEISSQIDFKKFMEEVASNPIEWDINEYKSLAFSVVDALRSSGRESVKIRLSIAIDLKLGSEFFKSLSERHLLPIHLVNRALEDKLVIVDLSGEDPVVKKYVVYAIMNELWRRIEISRKRIDTVVIVDEAHNYACRYCGSTQRIIARTAREGRKWGVGVVLVSQRAVDLDPEIRGNINTWIFSKLQTPSDYNEISAYMDLAGISEASLSVLGRREFYVAGLMNPLKTPILLRVRDVGDPGRARR